MRRRRKLETTDPTEGCRDQDAQPVKAGDDQDAQPVKTADDQDVQPVKAGDDQNAQPAKAGDQRDAQPVKAADDQDLQPVKAGDDQDTQPARAADQGQPEKSGGDQNPTKAAAPAPHPTTPEQQKFEKDTAELLQLVQELKVEVEKAGSNTLSLAALRKADEIQRLAKNLKEKMKTEGQAFASKP